MSLLTSRTSTGGCAGISGSSALGCARLDCCPFGSSSTPKVSQPGVVVVGEGPGVIVVAAVRTFGDGGRRHRGSPCAGSLIGGLPAREPAAIAEFVWVRSLARRRRGFDSHSAADDAVPASGMPPSLV